MYDAIRGLDGLSDEFDHLSGFAFGTEVVSYHD
jgi:hypothetical protein